VLSHSVIIIYSVRIRWRMARVSLKRLRFSKDQRKDINIVKVSFLCQLISMALSTITLRCMVHFYKTSKNLSYVWAVQQKISIMDVSIWFCNNYGEILYKRNTWECNIIPARSFFARYFTRFSRIIVLATYHGFARGQRWY
jgi:hypothetical protein